MTTVTVERKTERVTPKSRAATQAARDRVRINAAKLRIVTDRKQGLPTPPWVFALAAGDTTAHP
ncbi:MAG: hypothetical protein FWG25_09970 [Promicromonosporaceae bacterium]|nr:hypothetical protein [Promicromonosporaceae bacterium]